MMFYRHQRVLLGCLLAGLWMSGAMATESPLETYLQQQALRDQLKAAYGAAVLPRLDQWIATLKRQENMAERNKIESVNNFFNQLVYVPDQRF